jgi:hypothetical protein
MLELLERLPQPLLVDAVVALGSEEDAALVVVHADDGVSTLGEVGADF